MTPIQDPEVGDLVEARGGIHGVVVGFNEKGEGGKDFVHILVEGEILIFMCFDVNVVIPSNEQIGTANNKNI